MEETDKNNEASQATDESTENIFEDLARELVAYREALCRLVIVPEDNDYKEVEISNNGSKTVKNTAEDLKEFTDISIGSDKFSIDNNIEMSDPGIQDFHTGNSKSSSEAMIPNSNTLAEKPPKRSDLLICSDSKKSSETLNTSCHGNSETACTFDTKSTDYVSKTSTNNREKDTKASSDCDSETSTTNFQFSDSDSSIASSYLKISEKYLGTSSTRMFTEENLRRLFSNIKQNSPEGEVLNCSSKTLMDLANYPRHFTEVSTSFITTGEDGSRQNLELKSSEVPEAELDNTSSDSNLNSAEVLKALDRNSECGNSGINISNGISEIHDSILKVSDTDRIAEPDRESSEVLWTKLRNLVKTFDGFQDASVRVFGDIIEEFSDLHPTLDNDQEASFHSEAKREREVPTKGTNTEDKCESLNTPTRSFSSDSDSIQSEVLTFSDYFECCYSDFKFSDCDEETLHADLRFTDSNNESKTDKRPSNVLCVQKDIQNLIDTNDQVQDFGHEGVVTGETFSNIELTSNDDQETPASLPETKRKEVTTDSTIADDQCDRLESLAYSKDTNTTAECQNISKEVKTAETFPNMELTSDNDQETLVSANETEGQEVSAHSQNETDYSDRFSHQKETNTETSSEKENPGISPGWSQDFYQKEMNTEALSDKELNSDDGLVTSVSLTEATGIQATADSTTVDDKCERLEPLVCSDDSNASNKIEVSTAEEFSNPKLTSEDGLVTSVILPETKGNEVSAYSKDTKDECDRLEALICAHPNTSWTEDFHGQEVINTETSSNIEYTSDYTQVASTSSRDTKGIRAAISPFDLQHATAFVIKSALSGNVSDCNSQRYLLSQIEEEMKCFSLPSDVLRKWKTFTNHINNASQNAMSPGFFLNTQNQDTTVESSSKMKPIFTLGNEHTKRVGPHRTVENEMSSNLVHTDSLTRQTALIPQLSLLDSLAKSNSIGNESSSTSDSKDKSSTDTMMCAEEERKHTDELERQALALSRQRLPNYLSKVDSSLSRIKKTSICDESSSPTDSTEESSEDSTRHTEEERIRTERPAVSFTLFRPQAYLCKADSSPSIFPKISFSDESSSPTDSTEASSEGSTRHTEDEKGQTAELNPTLLIGNDKKDSIETKDDAETIEDIFKRVIKCHPVKKFPFESPNAERTSRKLKDPVKKDVCGTFERCNFEHKNILEAIYNADRDSFMVLDVTDSFNQECCAMCEGLIKEYLKISDKMFSLLIKEIKNLSAEEWKSRMSNVLTLDDELGYFSAKLITAMNDCVKQYRDIEKNIRQPITGSQDLYHMGILEICLQLVCILLDFVYDKQLQLENHENALRLERDD